MKRITTIMCLIVVSISLYTANIFAESQVHNQEPEQPDYLKTIPPDKLKEDLDFLLKTIEEVHVNMYAYTSKEEFDPTWEKLYESINRPMNRIEFYKLTAPTVALLKNGHTFIEPPLREFQEYAKRGGKVFALGVHCDEDSVILSDYYGPLDLSVGARIVTIDNQSAKSIRY